MNDLLKGGERLFENDIEAPETLIADKEGENGFSTIANNIYSVKKKIHDWESAIF